LDRASGGRVGLTPGGAAATAEEALGDRRAAIRPGLRLLDLCRQTDQRCLVAGTSYQLHTHREADVVGMKREGNGRLSGRVPRRRERDERRGVEQLRDRLVRVAIRTDNRWRPRDGRSDQNIDLVEEPDQRPALRPDPLL